MVTGNILAPCPQVAQNQMVHELLWVNGINNIPLQLCLDIYFLPLKGISEKSNSCRGVQPFC